VAPSSAEACSAFLTGIRSGGFARASLRIGNRDVHCFGWCERGVIRIVAVIDPITAAAAAASLAEEDPGFFRLAEEIRRAHSTYELYEELARLNNDLVTSQRELARTVAELRRLNDYKDELLGMAAHDLRNPLHANAAFITFLLNDADRLSSDDLVLLERLRANSQYMLRLVENVLDFSAIQAGHVQLHREETSLHELVSSVVETMRIMADARQIEIRCTADESLPNVSVDCVKITQAVQNLLSNAVQYSPDGSVVDVRLLRHGPSIDIEVEDRGPGIPASEIPSLFKPFTRLSTSSSIRDRSIGLGLAITRRLVEAHGGTIEVTSEVGKGSKFTICLRGVA
jgi:signal transduction histidine kinase